MSSEIKDFEKDTEVDLKPDNGDTEYKKTIKSYTYAKRKLKEEELLNPGSINLLIDELIRLEKDSKELRDLRDMFHKIDKTNAINEQKLTTLKTSEILQTLSLGLGTLLIGASKSLWDIGYIGIIILSLGLLLTFAAILNKATGLLK